VIIMTAKKKTYTDIIELLARPFRPDEIHFIAKGGYVMAYTDARAVRSRLTLAAGGEWSTKLIPLATGDIICEMTVLGVTRTDVGEVAGFGGSGAKGAASDSIKRAAFSHGVGEYLYDLPRWKAQDGPPPMTVSGLKYWRHRYVQWLQSYGVEHYGQPVGYDVQLEDEPDLIKHVSDYFAVRQQVAMAIKDQLMTVADVRAIVDQLDLPEDMGAWNSRSRLDFMVDFGRQLVDREQSRKVLDKVTDHE
jgi:hypothetical protein